MSTATHTDKPAALPLGYDWLATNAVERNLFFEPAMIEPALRHLSAEGVELCVATDAEFAIPRAAMPVVRARGRYGPVPTPVPLQVWHHPYSMVGTPLVSPEEPETALDALFAKAGRRTDGPPVLLMPMILADGAVWALIERVVEKSGRRLHVLHTVERAGLRLDEQAAQAASLRTILGGKRLQSVKASRRKLKAEGELAHRIATSGDDLTDALSQFLALEAGGWKGRMGTALSSLGHDRYAQSVVANLAKDGRVRIDLTCLKGANGPDRPLGGALSIKAGTDDAPIWMPWKVAYDEQFVRAGPGVLTLASLTESLLGECQKADQPLLIDSLASPDSQLAQKLWRDRWTLVDVLIDLKPGGSGAFGPILLAEKARRSAFVAGKAARAAIKQAAKRAQATLKR